MQNASISPAYNRIPSDGVTPLVMAPNDSLRYPTAGCRYFRIISSTAVLNISFDDGPEIPMRAGMAYQAPVNFNSVTITNRSGAANTIDVVWSAGEITDNALSLTSSVTVNGGGTIQTGVEVSIAGNTGSQFYPGYTNVYKAVISNPETNFYPFRIGAWNPYNGGIWLNPGDSVTLELSGAMSAYNTAPYPQKISFAKLSR